MEIPFFDLEVKGNHRRASGSFTQKFGTPIADSSSGKRAGVWTEWRWDGQRLHITSDRLGFYPLFYHSSPSRFIISPSIPKLIEHGVSRELDFPAVNLFFRFGGYLADSTPFRQIKALPAGADIELPSADGVITHQRPSAPLSLHISYGDAVDGYIQLFRDAISRRLTATDSGATIVPLSGGRDSRHILLELARQDQPNLQTATSRWSGNDAEIAVAKELSARLQIPHTLVPQTRRMRTELVRPAAVAFCSDEHGQMLNLGAYLTHIGPSAVFDGLAGDVLSAGLFYSQKLFDLARAGKFKEMADSILRTPDTITPLLEPSMRPNFAYDDARNLLATELALFADWPDPINAFYFWNRTRREIALSPFRLYGDLKVHTPYLDDELVSFLTSLPVEVTGGKKLHTDAILRAYPEFADIPFAGARSPVGDKFMQLSRLPAILCYVKRTGGSAPRHSKVLSHRWIGALINKRIRQSSLWANEGNIIYLAQLLALSRGEMLPEFDTVRFYKQAAIDLAAKVMALDRRKVS